MEYDQPLPFYMPYPILLPFEQEKEQEKDREVMKSYYSRRALAIQEKVERECDRMEYDGSMMFDEFPDKTGIDRIVNAVYEKAKYMENMYRPVLEESDELEMTGHCVSCRGQESWLENLIRVILLNEMNVRRRRYFKRRGRR